MDSLHYKNFEAANNTLNRMPWECVCVLNNLAQFIGIFIAWKKNFNFFFYHLDFVRKNRRWWWWNRSKRERDVKRIPRRVQWWQDLIIIIIIMIKFAIKKKTLDNNNTFRASSRIMLSVLINNQQQQQQKITIKNYKWITIMQYETIFGNHGQ